MKLNMIFRQSDILIISDNSILKEKYRIISSKLSEEVFGWIWLDMFINFRTRDLFDTWSSTLLIHTHNRHTNCNNNKKSNQLLYFTFWYRKWRKYLNIFSTKTLKSKERCLVLTGCWTKNNIVSQNMKWPFACAFVEKHKIM